MCILLPIFSPFKVVYGFNQITPLHFISLPVSERLTLDGKRKAKFVRNLHEKVKANIEKKNLKYTNKLTRVRRRFYLSLENGCGFT